MKSLTPGKSPARSRAPRLIMSGSTLVETLIAAPIVLLLGLSALQWALVFHARSGVAYALHEAARAGSVGAAESLAIDAGLARGLVPYLYGAADAGSYTANLARSVAHVEQGRAAGWIELRRIAPTAQSFDDWAEPALDADGNPIAGVREIPNDNLAYRITTTQPASGVAAQRGAEPIGSVSGQSLADANLLKLELTYGVPLSVPLIGKIAGWLMRAVDGCEPSRGKRLGLVDLGMPEGSPRAWACPFYGSSDGGPSRWPVRVAATMRMQSPARSAGNAVRSQAAQVGASLGVGAIDAADTFEPPPLPSSPRGTDGQPVASASRAAGFLNLGGQREIFNLGACASN